MIVEKKQSSVKLRRALLRWLALGLLFASTHALAQSTGTVTYVYTDPQGTPLAETDANGNITATFDYTPYGTYVPQGTSMPGPTPNGPGYTGHVNDPETNLVYMQARYYDPATGHFLSVDPGEKTPVGGLFVINRYAYVSNNPNIYVDPDGRQEVLLSSSAFEPRPILETLRPNPLTDAVRQGIRNPIPRTPAERAADLARQAGVKRTSPSDWKAGTREPWIPPEVPKGIDHLDDLPDIIRLMYHLIRFASSGHPTVTVGPTQPQQEPPEQQPKQPQPPQSQPQPQQQQQPQPETCTPPMCA